MTDDLTVDPPPPVYPEFLVYSVGLCFTSVCTSLPDDEATDRLNAERPTGVSPWQVADEDFADGTPNGVPCPNQAGNRHVLFNC